MRCDYCNCPLTPANDGGYAPNGLPLYVCEACYQKLKCSKIIQSQSQSQSQNGRKRRNENGN